MRGGDPTQTNKNMDGVNFSPHARGVIQETLAEALTYLASPRMRGGDPMTVTVGPGLACFSPHTQG